MASMEIQGSPKGAPMENGHEKGYLLGVVSASSAAVGTAADVAKKIPEMKRIGQRKTSEIVLPCTRERSLDCSTLTRQWANSGSNSGS